MNYRYWHTGVIMCTMFASMAASHRDAQPVPLPGLAGKSSAAITQEKFKVVVQKGSGSLGKDFDFYYLFCKVNPVVEGGIEPNLAVREKKMSAKTITPKRFNGGFSKLLEKASVLSSLTGSSTAEPINETESIRFFVSKDWRALEAKRKNKASPQQNEAIFVVEPPVKRYRPDLCSTVGAGFVGSVVGQVVFTVDQDATTSLGLKATMKDERICKPSKSKVSTAKKPTKSASERLKSAKNKATESAKKAWSSTKNAASKAKQKVSSAASSAKASFTKRFGSGSTSK